MIFYRLGLRKLIEYFKLDQLFKDDELRQMLLHKKPKEVYRTKLKANRTMDLCISTLLSLISSLVCLSIPYAALDTPCEVLKQNNLTTIYNVASYFENYVDLIDRVIIALSIILVFITVKTIVDAINNTDINMSPWLERGKYVLPKKTRNVQNRSSIDS
ncbi:uncharacterized protein LOC113499246 [Trichoplusia ni]|uniref:Uncharacterized protein LOC113499246 n=1 Tax=Trichoplusia ni TaxID=7111 RepID=A0A7E5W5F1_TRINI|nr:uncharacterized protein LOC113499246 [Trichoplusia ni]